MLKESLLSQPQEAPQDPEPLAELERKRRRLAFTCLVAWTVMEILLSIVVLERNKGDWVTINRNQDGQKIDAWKLGMYGTNQVFIKGTVAHKVIDLYRFIDDIVINSAMLPLMKVVLTLGIIWVMDVNPYRCYFWPVLVGVMGMSFFAYDAYAHEKLLSTTFPKKINFVYPTWGPIPPEIAGYSEYPKLTINGATAILGDVSVLRDFLFGIFVGRLTSLMCTILVLFVLDLHLLA